MVGKLEKRILTISRLIGQPTMFHIVVVKDKIEIYNVDGCLVEEDDGGPPVKLDTKGKINKPFTYIG